MLGGDQRESSNDQRGGRKTEQMRGSTILGFERECTHRGEARCTPLHNNKSPLSNKPPKPAPPARERCVQGMIKGPVYVCSFFMYTHDKDIKTETRAKQYLPVCLMRKTE